MDKFAAGIANMLIGNSRNEAVLEITLHGLEIIFLQDSLVSFAGGGSRPYADHLALDIYKAIWIPKDTVVNFRHHPDGCRLYMGIAGGWSEPLFMKSRSCYPIAGAGKLIKAGDQLSGGLPSPLAVKIVGEMDTSKVSMAGWGYHETEKEKSYLQSESVRVTRGPEWDLFSEDSRNSWLRSSFTVTQSSNRMGYRLSGDPLLLAIKKEMISTAVTTGMVQVTPDGMPLLLMADAQTIGGYPRIATVIDADLTICAQKKPGDKIRFAEETVQNAEALYIQREEQLLRIEHLINTKMQI
jgi:antagonist of KipI